MYLVFKNMARLFAQNYSSFAELSKILTHPPNFPCLYDRNYCVSEKQLALISNQNLHKFAYLFII